MPETRTVDGSDDTDPLASDKLPLAPGANAGEQITDAAKIAHDQIERAIEFMRTLQNKIDTEAVVLAAKTDEYTSLARKISAIFLGLAKQHN